MPNRLIDETSPYLLQHANNPVDWYPWGEEALERARADDKPILLSVGYSACHWCHVMERESFENPDIAAQMNDNFVSVKVDREERPDIDSIYMTAVQAMTGHGGWPMTVFLTPDGKPFYGGTYFPPEDRGGMPSFPRVLEAISDAYSNNRSDVLQNTEHLLERMRQMSAVAQQGVEPLTDEVMRLAMRKAASDFDDRHGGFGLQPKFPQPMTYEFLLRHYLRTEDADALHMVELTLQRMAMGWHIRPDWRRVSSLFDRHILARTALRKDALRQRAACAPLLACIPDYGQSDVQSHRGGDAGICDARDDIA